MIFAACGTHIYIYMHFCNISGFVGLHSGMDDWSVSGNISIKFQTFFFLGKKWSNIIFPYSSQSSFPFQQILLPKFSADFFRNYQTNFWKQNDIYFATTCLPHHCSEGIPHRHRTVCYISCYVILNVLSLVCLRTGRFLTRTC